MTVTLGTEGGRLRLAATPTERRQAQQVLCDDSSALPDELAGLVKQVLSAVAAGTPVSLSTLPDELTTTMAARQLGVSRPTLMRMIRDGELTARLVGTHHRLATADVLAAKRQRLARQRQAFDELRELEEQLAR